MSNNLRGGTRPGAGRPAHPAAPNAHMDPSEFLRAVMRGELVPSTAQMQAAVALVRVAAQQGKKSSAQVAASSAARSGVFAMRPPPKLAF